MANNIRQYQLVHRRRGTNTTTLLADAYSVRWTLRLNRPGTIEVILPAVGCRINQTGSAYEFNDFDEDDRLFLIRTVPPFTGRTIVSGGPFLIDRVEVKLEADGREVVVLQGQTALSILERRINPYNADDVRSDIAAAPASNVARQLVRQNFLAIAGSYVADPDPTRDASALLAVEADDGFGPAYELKAENGDILRLTRGAIDFAASQGVNMFHDVTYNAATDTFTYEIFNNVRGVDRAAIIAGSVTLREDVDFAEFSIRRDWSNLTRRVYAGGSGATGAARIYQTADIAGLAATVAANPLALREDFESSSGDTAAKILADANRALQIGDKLLQIEGKIVVGGRYNYGIDFNFGDRLFAVAEGQRLTVFVDLESGTLSDQGETLDIGISTAPTLRRTSTTADGALISAVSTVEDLTERLKRLE